MQSRIYLDNNATTGVDPKVLEAMLPELSTTPANPSSAHSFGREARARLSRARQQIADFLQVKPAELTFTSGGTESLNMLIRGLMPASGHCISSDVEHSAVFNTIQSLKGPTASFLKTGLWGAVRPEEVEKAIRPDTRLIVLSAVNSETGVKTDIDAIAKIAQARGILFLVDGVALLGKELFQIPPGVSGMAFSGHKFHAPKGIGLTYLKSPLKLESLITGGDQEYARRAGTENLPGIVGLAAAIELLKKELPTASQKMQRLRDQLEQGLKSRLGNVLINGEGPRVVNTSNLCFPDVDGETLLMQLDRAGIAVSHGSACSSGALEPSRVLLNMGVPHKSARSSLRLSLSRWTREEEIESCIERLSEIVISLRSLNT